LSADLSGTIGNAHNYVLIGGSGSGKSEVAINMALAEKNQGQHVHFFDLDQTKPLFRSRDVKADLEKAGITFHYEEQFYDAPTLVGGISEQLQSKDNCCVIDVGGNEVGSRAIGGFASLLNCTDCTVFFVINPFRPWSKTLIAIDETLNAVLKASGVVSCHAICNSNVGCATTVHEALQGISEVEELLGDRIPIDFVTVREEIAQKVAEHTRKQVFPLKLFLSYPWD